MISFDEYDSFCNEIIIVLERIDLIDDDGREGSAKSIFNIHSFQSSFQTPEKGELYFRYFIFRVMCMNKEPQATRYVGTRVRIITNANAILCIIYLPPCSLHSFHVIEYNSLLELTMAAEIAIFTFIYRGGGRDVVPLDATHVIMHEDVTAISVEAFYEHPNIVEVYCHAGVKKIERAAFYRCLRLKRLILPGLEFMGEMACDGCSALTCIECPKLERIGFWAFTCCDSLSNIDLPSAKVIEPYALDDCDAIKMANFGKNLETIGERAFAYCPSLERITIPLKNGLIRHDDIIFQGCVNLKIVDLVEAEELDETITALHLEEWRNDMSGEIDSFNQTLPTADAGYYNEHLDEDAGEKAIVIREWIARFLRKIIDYKELHHRLLNEAATALHLVAINDIVVDNVIPFLELPTHTFDGERD